MLTVAIDTEEGLLCQSRDQQAWNGARSVKGVTGKGLSFTHVIYRFDAHCSHLGTAIKHPVADRVKPSFVIFDIRALCRSGLNIRVPRCQKLHMTTEPGSAQDAL